MLLLLIKWTYGQMVYVYIYKLVLLSALVKELSS